MRLKNHLKEMAVISVVAVLSLVLLTSTTLPSMVTAQDGQGEPADSAERQAIPESIKKYELLTLDAQTLRAAVDGGQTMSLLFGDKTYVLDLIPNELKAENFKVVVTMEDGTKVEVPEEDFQTYKGTVVGEDKSEVRITISQEEVSGSVKTADEWFHIEPLRNYDKQADRFTHVAYRPADTDFVLDLSHDVLGSPDEVSDSYYYQSVNSAEIHYVTHKYPTNEEADLILDCDEEFYDINPSTWQSRQMSALNDAEGDYNSQIDVQFNVVQQSCDTTNSELTSIDAEDLWAELQGRWVSDPTSRHLVHLFTGKNIEDPENDPNVHVYGVAWHDGISDPENIGYGITQHVSETGYSASAFQKEILVAHELGHGFAATHEAAVEFTSDDYSIMHDPFVGSKMTDIFSDGTEGANFDNEETIRDSAEDHT